MAVEIVLKEGCPINKPPMQDIVKFSLWKARMKTFMMEFDIGDWFLVERGLGIPSNNQQFLNKIQDDAKAKHFLYEALDSHNFNLVLKCSTSKEIWERLEEMYGEGSEEDKSCECQCSICDKANKEEKPSITYSITQDATCLMALDEHEVTSNSNDLNSYTFDELQDAFDELQDAFDELALDFEKMNLRYKKIVTKLNIENEFLMKKN
ncbi:hypothetical protein PTKIN_Ptkin01aG0250500 [Pterospermum kingtungense]